MLRQSRQRGFRSSLSAGLFACDDNDDRVQGLSVQLVRLDSEDVSNSVYIHRQGDPRQNVHDLYCKLRADSTGQVSLNGSLTLAKMKSSANPGALTLWDILGFGCET